MNNWNVNARRHSNALYFITTINRFRNLAVGAENYGCQRAKYMLMVGAERVAIFPTNGHFSPLYVYFHVQRADIITQLIVVFSFSTYSVIEWNFSFTGYFIQFRLLLWLKYFYFEMYKKFSSFLLFFLRIDKRIRLFSKCSKSTVHL